MSVLHSCPPPESALRRTEEEALVLAGDYLNQYPKLERRIQSALAFRQRLIDIATGVSPRPAGEVRGGGQGDGIGWAVARLADLKEQTDRDVDRLCDLAREIHGRLEALERPRAAALLESLYIKGMRLEDAAASLHYETRYAWKVRRDTMIRLGFLLFRDPPSWAVPPEKDGSGNLSGPS